MKKLTLLMALFCLTVVAVTAQNNSANSTIEGNQTQVDIVQTGGDNNVLNNAIGSDNNIGFRQEGAANGTAATFTGNNIGSTTRQTEGDRNSATQTLTGDNIQSALLHLSLIHI